MGCGASTDLGGPERCGDAGDGCSYAQDPASPAGPAAEASDRRASSGGRPVSPTEGLDGRDNPHSPHFSDRSHLSEKELVQIKEISARRRKQKTLSNDPESLDHYRVQTGRIDDDDEYYNRNIELSESSMSDRDCTQSVNSMEISLGTSTSSLGGGSVGPTKSALKSSRSRGGQRLSQRPSHADRGTSPVPPPGEYLADPMEYFIDGNVDEKDLALLFPARVAAPPPSPHIQSPVLFKSCRFDGSGPPVGGEDSQAQLPPALAEDEDDLSTSTSTRKSVRFSVHNLSLSKQEVVGVSD